MSELPGYPQTEIVSDPETNHARHTAVGTMQGFIASALSLPTGILTAGFLTRKLGPEGYGLLTVAASIAIWIRMAITLGFNRTAVKFVAETKDWRPVASRIIQVQFLVSLAAMALLMGIAPVLSSWLDAPELATYLRLFSLDIPISALGNIHRSILIGRGSFGRRALLTAAYWLSRMVFIFFFVGLGLSITGAILASIGASTVVLIIARVFVRPALLGRSTLPLRNLWNYALPLFFYTIGMHLFKRLDLMFVKALSEIPQAAGFYGATKNLTIAVGLLATSLSPLLLAKLTQLSRQDQKEQAQVMSRQAMRLIFGLLPFAGMASGAAKEVVTAIYGRTFSPAGPLLALLIFAALGFTMISLNASMLIAAGRPELPFALTAPLVPLAIGAHFIFVPRFGSIGAAATTTGLSWLGAGISMLAVCKIWQTLPPVATIGRSILVCGLAYVLANLWSTPGFWVFLKLSVIGLAIILAFLLLREFSASEIALIRSMLRWRKVPE